MPKLAANLNLLWQELPYGDRIQAAAAAGFKAVEILDPFEHPARDTQSALTNAAIPLVMVAVPPPNYTGGERGFAAVPGGERRFQYDLRRALRFADALRVPMLQVLAGVASGTAARDTLIGNLRTALATLTEGHVLLLKPQAAHIAPGDFLNDFDLAAEILQELADPRVRLLFDSHHAAMLHGDAVAAYEKHQNLIHHIQIGDAPKRLAPGTDEIDFPKLFEAIAASGYSGWISAAYLSDGQTDDSLGWFKMLPEGWR